MKKYMNIALVAHDGRKRELLEWIEYNKDALSKHNLFATGTTGTLIENLGEKKIGTGVYYNHGHDEDLEIIRGPFYNKVTKLLSGPLGGDQQIGAMIAEGKIDILIFFCDNLIMQGHQNDVSALTRLASLYNIAFATNRTTADMIMTSPLINDPGYKRIIPTAIESYKRRKI